MEEKQLTDEEIVNIADKCLNTNNCIGCKIYSFNGNCKILEYQDCVFNVILNQKSEIERLTDTLNQYINGELINADTMAKIIFLEKQVDELMRDKGFLIAERTHIKEQAVKDTAKEILQYVGDLYDDGDQRFRLKDYQWHKNLCKRYGVEVE